MAGASLVGIDILDAIPSETEYSQRTYALPAYGRKGAQLNHVFCRPDTTLCSSSRMLERPIHQHLSAGCYDVCQVASTVLGRSTFGQHLARIQRRFGAK